FANEDQRDQVVLASDRATALARPRHELRTKPIAIIRRADRKAGFQRRPRLLPAHQDDGKSHADDSGGEHLILGVEASGEWLPACKIKRKPGRVAAKFSPWKIRPDGDQRE